MINILAESLLVFSEIGFGDDNGQVVDTVECLLHDAHLGVLTDGHVLQQSIRYRQSFLEVVLDTGGTAGGSSLHAHLSILSLAGRTHRQLLHKTVE